MNIWKQSIGLKALCLGLFCFSESPVFSYEGYHPWCEPCCGGVPEVYVGAEVICWKPCINNLDWAVFSKDDIVASDEPVGKGRFLFVDPDWRAGLRLRLGKDMIYQGIGLCGSYTYFKAEQGENKDALQTQTLIPTLINGGLIPVNNFPATEARAHWSMRYQTFDVLLSYPMECYSCHLLTPYFGVEGMILHQRLSSQFLVNIEELRSEWESDFFGVGMKIGSFYTYQLNRCLSVFGDVSGSILHGNAEMKDRNFINIDSGLDRDLTLRYEDCLFLPGYRIAIGISTQFAICEIAIDLHIGYELLRWLNMPNPRRSIDDGSRLPISTSPSTSTLGLHGIFAGTELHF